MAVSLQIAMQVEGFIEHKRTDDNRGDHCD
jgi:hypothetical protein